MIICVSREVRAAPLDRRQRPDVRGQGPAQLLPAKLGKAIATHKDQVLFRVSFIGTAVLQLVKELRADSGPLPGAAIRLGRRHRSLLYKCTISGPRGRPELSNPDLIVDVPFRIIAGSTATAPNSVVALLAAGPAMRFCTYRWLAPTIAMPRSRRGEAQRKRLGQHNGSETTSDVAGRASTCACFM